MVTAVSICYKLLFITHLETCQNPSSPTDFAEEPYKQSSILVDSSIGIFFAMTRLQSAYNSVNIIETTTPESDAYSKFFGEITVTSGWDFKTAAHESVHAYNDKFKTGIDFAGWDDEGMGYGMMNIITWCDKILEVETIMKNNSLSCAQKGELAQAAWRNVWSAGGAGRKPADKDKFKNKVSAKIDYIDYINLKTHLAVSIRGDLAKDMLSTMAIVIDSLGESCCFNFSTDSGPWVDKPTGYGETYYVNDHEKVDSNFR